MIAGIFLCCVAVGITIGALFYGYGSVFLILALLPAAGLALGIVSLAYARSEFAEDDDLRDA
ncbi:MAG: hypothetical protein KJO42_16200 [Silicimonas sp.]|nr:hypothetical protein [Silicimonas sp.]NNF92801.1 hypothetical protein [Boseongicola sp.]RZV99732.1 MAG: hypothetical protein EX266_14690 [Paracoccaceae bacterium]MBT8425092.1 hypothetical protein [Silicimonas sp.]NND20060.1 hypothetical protein [Silicimonas sp.]